MPKDDKSKNKKQGPSITKRVISKDDSENNRYPDSKVPGVHRDSAPIGGGG